MQAATVLLLVAALFVGGAAVHTPTASLALSPVLPPDGIVSSTIELSHLGSYASGVLDEGAAEIVAYDAASRRLFVVNAAAATVDVLDLADPASPTFLFTIDAAALGGAANSVAVQGGLVAVAIEATPKTLPGLVAFFDVDGALLGTSPVGALPDMLTFTPDGSKVLVANEGEPNDYCTFGLAADPEGSVSVIDLSQGVANATVATAGFGGFASVPAGVRVYGPGATIAQDLEPEYIAVSPDGATAWVTLQEANAVAILDVASANIAAIVPLGLKDHSLPGQGLDASDKEGAINIANWPVWGMYQPDSIAAYESNGATYLVTANEGDARDYDCFAEEERGEKMPLDPVEFPDAATLKAKANLGRLTFTTATGDADGDGLFDELHVLGARSFSIRAADGSLVWDSGDALEQITAAAHPEFFNANNDENGDAGGESRSDNKGPEPEGVALGTILGRTYAFVGLERIGGIVVFDVTDPTAPAFVQYLNHRDFEETDLLASGDLGPEGLLFIPATESPTCAPLLVVGNEVSGTTSVYGIHAFLTTGSARVPLSAAALAGACATP